jgi:HTH-type transcriptional regulator / antitoxin HipB
VSTRLLAHGIVEGADDLGYAIQGLRESHKLTQTELAERLGISQRYVSELERGRPKILDDHYFDVLSKLGIRLKFEVIADE